MQTLYLTTLPVYDVHVHKIKRVTLLNINSKLKQEKSCCLSFTYNCNCRGKSFIRKKNYTKQKCKINSNKNSIVGIFNHRFLSRHIKLPQYGLFSLRESLWQILRHLRCLDQITGKLFCSLDSYLCSH